MTRDEAFEFLDRTARGIFLGLGIAGALLMTVFCRQLAQFQNQPDAWAAIGFLGPSALLICMMSTYRGFFQGQSNMIPTGEIRPVSKDPAYDFTSMKRIGDQMALPGLPDRMFDVNYVLNGTPSSEAGLTLAAELRDPASGRTMTVSTDLPGIQFYNGSKLSLRHWEGKDGVVYQAFNSLCLETQFFPDAPNQPSFPSIVLKAGETRTTHTMHRFSW